VTSDCDSGFRTLLADPAQRQIDMAVDGILRQDDFVEPLIDPAPATFLDTWTLVIPGLGEISGEFFLSDFELGAPYNEGTTFSATVQSSGAWTYTPEGP